MTKFNKGDKVRVVTVESIDIDDYKEGDILTVQHAQEDDSVHGKCTGYYQFGDDCHGLYGWQLELVEETQEFIEGDKVRVIGDQPFTEKPIGSVGIVRSTYGSYEVDFGDDHWWYDAKNLELVEDTSFKVGDKVRLVSHDETTRTHGYVSGLAEIGTVHEIGEFTASGGVRFVTEMYTYSAKDLELMEDKEPVEDALKAGDRVKCIDPNEHWGLFEGQEYTVKGIDDGFVNILGVDSGWLPGRFELVYSAEGFEELGNEDDEPNICITEMNETFQVDVPKADNTSEIIPLVFLNGTFVMFDEDTNDTPLHLTPKMLRAIVAHAATKARKHS